MASASVLYAPSEWGRYRASVGMGSTVLQKGYLSFLSFKEALWKRSFFIAKDSLRFRATILRCILIAFWWRCLLLFICDSILSLALLRFGRASTPRKCNPWPHSDPNTVVVQNIDNWQVKLHSPARHRKLNQPNQIIERCLGPKTLHRDVLFAVAVLGAILYNVGLLFFGSINWLLTFNAYNCNRR